MIEPRHRNTALLVAGCFFMENLDGTIVTTAAPKIGRALGVPATSVGLVIAAYLVTLAVLIPLSGWLTSRWGERPVFLAAIAVFTFASLACALSVNLTELVAFRVLQGAGGAMMVPVGRLVVLSQTGKGDMLRVMSMLVWPGLLGPVIAPLAGGVITTYASWRWLFLINVPLGVIAFGAAWGLIQSRARSAPPPLDVVGVLLVCSGLAGATYTAYLLSRPTVVWGPIGALAGVSATLLAAATVHLLRARNPLLNLRTLHVATFRAALGSGSVFWCAVTAVPFLLTLRFQNVFGWSPIKSGAVVMFIFLGNIGIKPATTPLLRRFGFRQVLIAATLLAAATLIVSPLLVAATPLVLIGAIAVLNGIGRSTGLTCYSTIGFSDTPPDEMRDANTLQSTAMQLSIGMGAPLVTVALRAGRPLSHLVSGGSGASGAYTVAFLALAAMALLATAGALRLRPDAGSSITSHARPAAGVSTEPVAASDAS